MDVVKTIFSYSSGEDKHLVYAANGKLFKLDVTEYEPVLLQEGFHEDKWQYTQYKSRLFMVNGVDNPQSYDGASLTDNPFTSDDGLDTKTLINVMLYKNRLFFIERDSLRFWYTELAGNIAGNLKSFDLSQHAKIRRHLWNMKTHCSIHKN